jgi:hypothetical protein
LSTSGFEVKKVANFSPSKHIFLPNQYEIPLSSSILLLTISCAVVTPTPTNLAKPHTTMIMSINTHHPISLKIYARRPNPQLATPKN